MSNLGKCGKCEKTVYGMEGFKVGPPSKEVAFHKGCFKCSNPGCVWTLNFQNYTWYEGKPYCKTHYPVNGVSNASVKVIPGQMTANTSVQSASTPAPEPEANSAPSGSVKDRIAAYGK